MNTEYQAHKISETAKTPNRLNAIWYKGNPYMALNDDFSKKYKPNQYCTVLTRMYDEETTTALSSMSLNPDMEILNLPRAPFKMAAMEMLIKEIMANIQDMNNPFDGDFKRAFFAMVIDIAHRTSFLAQHHNAFIISLDLFKAAVRIAQKNQPQHRHTVLIRGQLRPRSQKICGFPQFGFQFAHFNHLCLFFPGFRV